MAPSIILGKKKISKSVADRQKRGNKSGAEKKSSRSKKPVKKTHLGRRTRFVMIAILIVSALYMLFTSALLNDLYNNRELRDSLAVNSILKSHFSVVDSVDSRLIILTGDEDGEKIIKDVFLVISNIEKGDGMVYHIPGAVYFNTTVNDLSDNISVRNLYYLGELYSEGKGYEYTVWELQNLLGVHLDGYIWIEPEGVDLITDYAELSSRELLTGILKDANFSTLILNPARTNRYLANTLSNSTPLDIVSLFRFLGDGLSTEEIDFVDLASTESVSREFLQSNNEVAFFSREKYDEFNTGSLDILRSREIEREQSKVEVFNGSVIAGQAYRYTRLLENNGLNVIRINNTSKGYSKSVIYSQKPDEFTNTIELIQSLVPLDVEVVEGRPDFLTTADVIIILGQDLQKEFQWLQ